MPERDRRWRRNQYAKELQKKQYRQRKIQGRRFYQELRDRRILTELEEQEKDYMKGFQIEEIPN